MLSEDVGTSYKYVFMRALKGVSFAALLARVVLAARIHFLFHFDPEWTAQHVCPLLDAELDEERAKQCWHGYLYWGRWTDSMLVKMMHSYESMFPLIDYEKDDFQRFFCSHLSAIAVYSSFHPLEQGWLFRFLTSVKPSTRVMWAAELRPVIGALDKDTKIHLWQRWLKTYWQERLQGRPLPLSTKETAEMIEWATALSPMFSEVVELIRKSPYPDFGQSMAYYGLANSELLKECPDAFAELFFFLAAGEKNRPVYDLGELFSAVEELAALIPKNPRLRSLCELARLGAAGVAVLAAKLSAAAP
jgi:Domain of unknown function (DUF4020)